MKKAGLLLRIGFVALAATIISTGAFAQDHAKKPGRKDVTTSAAKKVVKSPIVNQVKPVAKNHQSVVHAQLNPKLAVQKRGAVVSTTQGTGARACTPKNQAKAYSITRKNFNNLPKDRQEFVMSHLDKYSIVD